MATPRALLGQEALLGLEQLLAFVPSYDNGSARKRNELVLGKNKTIKNLDEKSCWLCSPGRGWFSEPAASRFKGYSPPKAGRKLRDLCHCWQQSLGWRDSSLYRFLIGEFLALLRMY